MSKVRYELLDVYMRVENLKRELEDCAEAVRRMCGMFEDDEASAEKVDDYIRGLEEELMDLREQNRQMSGRVSDDEEGDRICSVCGKKMTSGYVVDDCEYYCSDGCLMGKYTLEEYGRLYKDDAAYWTEWE